MKPITSFNRLPATIFLIFIAGLIIARIVYSENIRYISLAWNIFLAQMPYILVLPFPITGLKMETVFICKLAAIFPQRFIHSNRPHPSWGSYTCAFMVWCCFIICFFFYRYHDGFCVASESRIFTERIFLKTHSNGPDSADTLFGLIWRLPGPFPRWNSWDVIHNPLALGIDILNHRLFPRLIIWRHGLSPSFLLPCIRWCIPG